MNETDQIERIAAANGVVLGYAGSFGSYSATIDGIGTKALLLAEENKWWQIGWDAAVAALNDLVCVGTKPIGLTDYVGLETFDENILSAILKGIRDACDLAGCSLIAGETAIMPDIYRSGAVDVVCNVFGGPVHSNDVRSGDTIIGLDANGPHANGYTLIRQAKAKDPIGWLTHSKMVLSPSRLYAFIADEKEVCAAAHVSGGGLNRACRRLTPNHKYAFPELPNWTAWLASTLGLITPADHFNCGIGFLVALRPSDSPAFTARLKDRGIGTRIIATAVIA